MKVPTSAWTGSDPYAMAEQRAERWQMRAEQAREERDQAQRRLDDLLHAVGVK